MHYKKQSHNACLAYALWQIDAVDEKAVRVLERARSYESWDGLNKWTAKYAPRLIGRLQASLLSPIPTSNNSLVGKGVVHLSNKWRNSAHAISYEDGVVLDPNKPEEQLSLEEYLKKYPRWEVVGVFPMGDKEKG